MRSLVDMSIRIFAGYHLPIVFYLQYYCNPFSRNLPAIPKIVRQAATGTYLSVAAALQYRGFPVSENKPISRIPE